MVKAVAKQCRQDDRTAHLRDTRALNDLLDVIHHYLGHQAHEDGCHNKHQGGLCAGPVRGGMPLLFPGIRVSALRTLVVDVLVRA